MTSQHTNAKGQIIEIIWDDDTQPGEDMDFPMSEELLTGKGTDGADYQAVAIYCHGEFDEIIDIDEA